MKLTKEQFKRDDNKIQSVIKETPTGMTVTDKLSILFPSRFVEKKMAIISSSIEVTGVVMILNNSYEYTVMRIPNLISFSPSTIENINIDDTEYILMEFKDSLFIDNLDIIDEAGILVSIIDEFVIKNHCPFYISNDDLFKILSKGSSTTSSNITKNIIVPELLTTLVVKTKDTKSSARSSVSKKDMATNRKTKIVGLESIAGLGNNISKIMGNYFNLGLTSALNNNTESEETELEKILKL